MRAVTLRRPREYCVEPTHMTVEIKMRRVPGAEADGASCGCGHYFIQDGRAWPLIKFIGAET